MKITWLGHSCFKIEDHNIILILDPYKDGSVDGLKNLRETAQLVLCSHDHGDHCGRETITLAGQLPSDLKITPIDTFHDHHRGTHRGTNKIHLIELSGYRIVHLGDLGCPLTEEQISLLQNPDLLLIPVGGYYTINAAEAAEITELLAPKKVIPMHYHDSDHHFGYEVLGPVTAFTDHFPEAAFLSSSSLSTEDLPKQQIIVLTPANCIS